MAVTSTNSALESITSSYQSSETTQAEKEEALGRDTFLTMLVAQLQNQDPLNPMDGTDFSAQLAQFSQLEQLINLNDSMETLASAFTEKSEGDMMSYLGKQVTANVDVMNIEDGTVSGGFYSLSAPADVMITITDDSGNTVKTLYEGQQTAGSHLISWDGTNNSGDALDDGTYHYTVMANSGSGYAEVPATLSGTVDGVTYNNGSPYLVVQGILIDPDSLLSVVDSSSSSSDSTGENAATYLGRTVTSSAPIVLVDDGVVSGQDLGFELDSSESVTVKIYDAYDELVRTITLSADETSAGSNTVHWDAVADTGYQVSDGLYYYTVKTADGFAGTSVTEEVSGIKNMNNTQYLVMGESGRLVALSTITEIQ